MKLTNQTRLKEKLRVALTPVPSTRPSPSLTEEWHPSALAAVHVDVFGRPCGGRGVVSCDRRVPSRGRFRDSPVPFLNDRDQKEVVRLSGASSCFFLKQRFPLLGGLSTRV